MRRYRASWPGSTACPARSERWVSRTGTLARDSAHPACRRAARAHSSVEEHSPYKRRVTGSNPVAPTRPEAIWCMAASRRGAKRGAKHVALASWRTLQAGAAGMAKMPSTSRRTRTGRSARSRSVSARTVSACAGRSLARPSKRSGTSSRPSTRSWTLACSLRRDTRSRRRWTRGSSTGCQAGRRGRSSCTDGALPAVGDLHRPGRAAGAAIGVDPGAVPADHLRSRPGDQPLGERVRRAVVEDVDRAAGRATSNQAHRTVRYTLRLPSSET
jgi:hypothetical protein